MTRLLCLLAALSLAAVAPLAAADRGDELLDLVPEGPPGQGCRPACVQPTPIDGPGDSEPCRPSC